MDKKQLDQLLRTYQQLQKQKYPLPVIVIVLLATAFLGVDPLNFLQPSAPSSGCQVVRVSDGDTMTLKCAGQADDVKVRMYCIDTPEKKQAPWGAQAGAHLKALADVGASVTLVEIDKDRYGRTVGEVYNSQNVNLNLAQVEAGHAAVYEQYCKKPEYSRVETEAKRAKRGIWAEPGLQQTPWEWRRQQRS